MSYFHPLYFTRHIRKCCVIEMVQALKLYIVRPPYVFVTIARWPSMDTYDPRQSHLRGKPGDRRVARVVRDATFVRVAFVREAFVEHVGVRLRGASAGTYVQALV